MRQALWLVSLKDKETTGERCIRFAVVEGTEHDALRFGRHACEELAHAKTDPRGRVVPIVEPLRPERWYRTSRFFGSPE